MNSFKTPVSLRWCGKRIANRIIAAARPGERDPARLLEAALRSRD
jgi:hypothetical protein